MPESTEKSHTTTRKKGSWVGTAVRTLAPAVPLGIALVHGALTAKKTPPAPAPAAQVEEAKAPAMTATSGGVCGKDMPCPLLAKDKPVDWWFVFKFNAKTLPMCTGGDTRTCKLFGGTVQKTSKYAHFSQQYAYASSVDPTLQQGGPDCTGTSTDDPVGATFDEVYNGSFFYVVWNDQPYQDASMPACSSGSSCSSSFGHSKGVVAWNKDGNGFVMQVSTPDWPQSGSASHPRKDDGNTLGCLSKDNDVEVSQHFFAKKLNEADLKLVLQGMVNASVATNVDSPQMVNAGGPQEIQDIVAQLKSRSKSTTVVTGMLSGNVQLISKPGKLAVPPWQLVSSELGQVSLLVANWYVTQDKIPNTTATTPVTCWDPSLKKPGAVKITEQGMWNGSPIGLDGGDKPDGNHAKVAVSTSGSVPYTIFGDMNQEGSLSGSCTVSQNGRGGMFFVLTDPKLAASVGSLIGR